MILGLFLSGFRNDRGSFDGGEDFPTWWHRPLCGGFSIVEGSSDELRAASETSKRWGTVPRNRESRIGSR